MLNFYRVRTPGNRLVVQYLKKLHLKHRSIPKCAETGKPLRGVKPNRGNYKNRRLSQLQMKRKAVSRAYGGNLSHQALRLRYISLQMNLCKDIYLYFFNRIMRAFLTEEVRIASKVRRVQRKARVQAQLKKRSRAQKKIKSRQRKAEKRKIMKSKKKANKESKKTKGKQTKSDVEMKESGKKQKRKRSKKGKTTTQ